MSLYRLLGPPSCVLASRLNQSIEEAGIRGYTQHMQFQSHLNRFSWILLSASFRTMKLRQLAHVVPTSMVCYA